MASVALLLSSCYKSILCDPTPPDMGWVEVNVVLPTDNTDPYTHTGYILIMDGQEYEIGEDGTYVFDEGHAPGEYTVYIYSEVFELVMQNNIDENSTGTIIASASYDAGVVNTFAEDLYFGSQTITVLADQIIYSDVHLTQETRTIKFDLHVSDGDPELIASCEASLSGVAHQWECVADIPSGDAASIKPAFTQGESLTKADETNDYLTSSIKILGINGDEQILTIELTYSNGSSYTFTSDLSEELAGSNDTKPTPIILSGYLEAPTESNPSGTILDWVTTQYEVEIE